MDIPTIVEGMHQAAGLDIGSADIVQLVLALLGPRAIRIVPARYDECAIDPLIRSGRDGYKIRIPESAISDAGRRSEQLALGLAVWRFRRMASSQRRARAVRLLVHELLYPSARALSGVIKTAQRSSDEDDVPVPCSSNG